MNRKEARMVIAQWDDTQENIAGVQAMEACADKYEMLESLYKSRKSIEHDYHEAMELLYF
jgi:hypothetical protein